MKILMYVTIPIMSHAIMEKLLNCMSFKQH